MKAVINQNLDEEPSMLMQIDQTLLDRTKNLQQCNEHFVSFQSALWPIFMYIKLVQK